VKTPFGDPSDAIVLGRWKEARGVFGAAWARHRILPGEIIIAQIFNAMKLLGVGAHHFP